MDNTLLLEEDEDVLEDAGDYEQRYDIFETDKSSYSYSPSFSRSYLKAYGGYKETWDRDKEQIIEDAVSDVLLSMEVDEEIKEIMLEIAAEIVREQVEKQHCFGVFYYTQNDREIWAVPYRKYRTVEEMTGTYLNAEEKSEYARDNFMLVNMIANKYAPKSYYYSKFNYTDLFEAGLEGLTKALNTYKKNVNIKFSTYATTCIQRTVIDFMKKFANKRILPPLSTDAISDEDESFNFLNYCETAVNKDDEDTEYVEKDTDLMEVKKIINDILDKLDGIQSFIIKHKFGLNGCDILTKIEVSNRLHIKTYEYDKALDCGLQILKTEMISSGLDAESLAQFLG